MIRNPEYKSAAHAALDAIEAAERKPAKCFHVWVGGAAMVSGPGHLSEAKSAEWVATYRKINPALPPESIYTENTYR